MEEEKSNILLVEDDPAILKAITEGLSRRGFNILNADTGEYALKVIEEQEPDLVLLDLMLPDISGEKVLQTINEFGLIDKIPVIVLSNKADDASLNNCLSVLGAKDYIVKAELSLDEIARKAASLLGK